MDKNKSERDKRNNKYLNTLAYRLAETRKERKLSQEELAEATNVIREKIIYTEQNMKGRLLKVEDLAEIAKYLNVSIDYLLGLTDEKTTISKSTDDIADNSSPGIQSIINNEDNENIYKLYESILYITKNTLTSSLEQIEKSIEKKSTLSSFHIAQVYSACSFIDMIVVLDIPLLKINHEQKDILECGAKAIGNFLRYNKNKDLPILYEDIENMKKELEEIGDYLLYKLIKCNIERSIEEIAWNNIQNKRYYQKINSFIFEYSKGLKPRTKNYC